MGNNKSYHFHAFLHRMKYINRWGLMRNTQNENLLEHSLQVSIIAHCLCEIKNSIFGGKVNSEFTALIAMFHDASETITGDLPTPVKYFNPDISRAYNGIEDIAKNKLISMLPDELKDSYKILFFKNHKTEESWDIVKAADRISAYIKCIEEEKAGNNEFKKAGESILKSIEQLENPEVKYFMDKFLPSFKLSLDELY